MLWWCRTFKVFRIDMKDDSRKMKEGWHKWLDPKQDMLFVVKEAICCMNIKFFFKQEKEKKSSWKARCSRGYSHAQCMLLKNLTWSRSSTRAKLHNTWNTKRHNWQNSCNLRVPRWRLQKLPRKLRKWEASCYQRKATCRRHRQTVFLERRGMKTYQGGGGAKHEEDNWESPSHHSSVHAQTSGTDCSQHFTPTEE